jgi:hypothetical protein
LEERKELCLKIPDETGFSKITKLFIEKTQCGKMELDAAE